VEEKKKTIQFVPMTRTQAAIGGGALISFFALWFLWAAVGQSVISWIESHPGIASWVQAIGSILAIIVAICIPYSQHQISLKNKFLNEIKISKIKWIFIKNDVQSYLDPIKSILKILEDLSREDKNKWMENLEYWVCVILNNSIEKLPKNSDFMELAFISDENIEKLLNLINEMKMYHQAIHSGEINKPDLKTIKYKLYYWRPPLEGYFNGLKRCISEYEDLVKKIDTNFSLG